MYTEDINERIKKTWKQLLNECKLVALKTELGKCKEGAN